MSPFIQRWLNPGALLLLSAGAGTAGVFAMAWPVAFPSGLSLIVGLGLGAPLLAAALAGWIGAVILDLRQTNIL